MTTKAISINLTSDLKRLLWLNILLIVSALTAVSIYLDNILLFVAALLSGLTAGIASQFYINSFYREKTESRLNATYDELKEEMSFDGLTGVYDRRAGTERLKEEFARSKRTGEDLSIAIIDADNFKLINDNYGHLTGDEVLRSIATTIKSWLRTEDVLFRYGGEEFVIIMPATNVDDASIPLERLREKLFNQSISYDNNNINVSVSIGVATALDESGNIEEVLSRADEALYDAKRTGKNKVVYHNGAKANLTAVNSEKFAAVH